MNSGVFFFFFSILHIVVSRKILLCFPLISYILSKLFLYKYEILLFDIVNSREIKCILCERLNSELHSSCYMFYTKSASACFIPDLLEIVSRLLTSLPFMKGDEILIYKRRV